MDPFEDDSTMWVNATKKIGSGIEEGNADVANAEVDNVPEYGGSSGSGVRV